MTPAELWGWPLRSVCENCSLVEQHPHVQSIGCCTRCASPLRRVAPTGADLLERRFILLVYGDQFESMPDSGAELLCFICARASEIDEFVERAVAWLDTAECAQFIERARSSDYGPHRRFLADLGTPKLRQRIECVAETAKALLELELNFYAPRQED